MEGEKSMMKRPMEEVYGSDPAEGYHKGKKKTKEHYRALLRLADEHRKSEWHEASSKAKCIAAKMNLLDAIIRAKGDFAEGNLADVKVKVPDWFKLGEKWMMDE
ncbi:hypothetical protein Bca4012_083547 [Brassica carinata]